MEHEIEPGEHFEGILVETFRDGKVSRPRVRPVGAFLRPYRVEFPRKLREDHSIGTRFICDMKVAQKHLGDGSPKGPPYLIADRGSIVKVSGQNPRVKVWAVERQGTISGRTYDYFAEVGKPEQKKAWDTQDILKKEWHVLAQVPETKMSEVQRQRRSELIRVYALMRSGGSCEACEQQAPFFSRNDKPYLETHHLTSLAAGGKDHPENVAAICPNCHARITYGRDGEAYNQKLAAKILQKEQSI